MKVFNWIKDTAQYLLGGVSRLFKPTDDDYPKTGIQPFEGEPNDDEKKYS